MSEIQKEPVSEILKRFSQDIVQTDDLLPATIFDTIMVRLLDDRLWTTLTTSLNERTAPRMTRGRRTTPSYDAKEKSNSH